MDKQISITKERRDRLEQELNYLKTTRTREVEAMITEAMIYGDLENNSEYTAAKCEQQKLLGGIAEIEEILSCAVVIETEEKQLSNVFLPALSKLIEDCGLSAKQAESYVQYCRIRFEQEKLEQYGALPTDSCLETLKEAQRIISEQTNSTMLYEYTIDRFLQVPCDQWQATKSAIMECFSCRRENVDALFSGDEEWLLVAPDSVYTLAAYLKALLSDNTVVWKIFCRAALLGVDTSKSRAEAVLDLLGEEFGKKVLHADAEKNVWFFYRYYSDPVGCIAYMKECGLSAEQILTIVQQDPDILYWYKEGRKQSYNHNQDYIDSIIQKYQ